MRVTLYGHMTRLPLAGRGTAVSMPNMKLFMAPDGRAGVVPSDTQRAPGIAVDVTHTEYELLKLAWLWYPTKELPLGDGSIVFAWRAMPSGATQIERWP